MFFSIFKVVNTEFKKKEKKMYKAKWGKDELCNCYFLILFEYDGN